MSTLDAKPKKVNKLNAKLLPVAAVLLLVLALLFMATPLLRGSTAFTRTGANQQFTGTFVPRTGLGSDSSGGQSFLPTPGIDSQGQGFAGQGFPSQGTGRTFANRPGGNLLRLSFLSGIIGTIIYASLLLVALAAALGMFLTKRWGQVLGIIMAVIYLLLGLVSFLPMLLARYLRGLNGLSLGLSIVHVVLAIAVIVLAIIPAKKVLAVVSTPPSTPPAANA
jgi:hypothetical protein